MDKENFDDIFNRFFGKKEENDKPSLPDDFKKIIEDLTSGIDKTDDVKNKIKDNSEKIVEKGEIDGKEFTKETWETEYGSLTKIIVNGSMDGKSPEEFIEQILGGNIFPSSKKETEKSLEKQLEDALKNEDYELCAILRDKIKQKNITNNSDNQ